MIKGIISVTVGVASIVVLQQLVENFPIFEADLESAIRTSSQYCCNKWIEAYTKLEEHVDQ